MVEELEFEWERRLQAAAEAIELLDRAGFNVLDFAIEEDAAETAFGIEATLSVGKQTYPLEALEDDDNTTDVTEDIGEEFALGLQAGMMLSQSCEKPDCPRGD